MEEEGGTNLTCRNLEGLIIISTCNLQKFDVVLMVIHHH